MLEWMLLVVGLLFVCLGALKTTGLKPLGDAVNESASTAFFIYGLLLVFIALFLFNSIVPLGAVVNETTTYSSDYFSFTNDSVTCVLCNFSASPTPIPCVDTYPACGGVCPMDYQCVYNAQSCYCAPLPLCEKGGYPVCGGWCPAAYYCNANETSGLCDCEGLS